MGKKTGTKKKGPKGKRARAKAKLDRQWGEHDLEEKKIRKGKSRLLKNENMLLDDEEAVFEYETEHDNDGFDDEKKIFSEEDSDSNGEDNFDSEDAFSGLLKSIEKKSRQLRRQTRKNHEVNDDISLEEDDKDSVITESDDGSQIDEDWKEDMDTCNDSKDPFTCHFTRDVLPESNTAIVKAFQDIHATTKLVAASLDKSLEIDISKTLLKNLQAGIDQTSDYSNDGFNGLIMNRLAPKYFKYNRKILKDNWKKTNKRVFSSNDDSSFSPRTKQCYLSDLQSVLYPAMASYADMLLTVETRKNYDALNNIISLHLINHVLTSRGRIQRNNKSIKDANGDAEISARDQGYTRPTILVLLPTRGVCYNFLSTIISMLGDTAIVENMDRFETEYGPEQIEEDVETTERRKIVLESKGHEWNALFGDEVNSDDDFKIGISFLPKTVKKTKNGKKSGIPVKLYSDFYKSDIILSSPLALKVGTGGEEEENDDDYLSSIEICYLASADVLMMQNWDHARDVFDLLNKQPQNNNDTDFSRVREYLLAGQAKHWRQFILCSKFTDPNILSTFKRNSSSIEGVMKIRRRVQSDRASLTDVLVPMKQVFQRVPCTSFSRQGEDRLNYFQKHVLPQIQLTNQSHTMIFVPSYFEFISLRNLLLKKDQIFVSVTEYARVSEVSRGRARFLQGRKPILLYTGRAHFFNRHTIKGSKHLIFYGLPENPDFYAQIANMVNLGLETDENDSTLSCMTLFNKFEAHALERICGKSNCQRMLKGEKSTFIFVS